MKKRLLPLLAALALATTTATAQNGVAAQAAGNYYGPLGIALMDESTMETITETDDEGNQILDSLGNPIIATYNVTITPETDTTVTFSLPNFGFMGLMLGDIVLTNVPVEQGADGIITFGENDPQNFNFLDGAILATAKINEATSYIRDDSVVVHVDVMWTNVDANLEPDDASDDVPIYVLFAGADPVKTGLTTATTPQRRATTDAYDLAGRRLTTQPTRGISIVGGRKVIR